MVNQLKMADTQTILSLHAKGWSTRRIAREMSMNRETVARCIRLQRAADSGASASFRLSEHSELPMRRMECALGIEAQVDFSRGAWLVDAGGKRRGAWVFADHLVA